MFTANLQKDWEEGLVALDDLEEHLPTFFSLADLNEFVEGQRATFGKCSLNDIEDEIKRLERYLSLAEKK